MLDNSALTPPANTSELRAVGWTLDADPTDFNGAVRAHRRSATA
jgi:hypothetical protein